MNFGLETATHASNVILQSCMFCINNSSAMSLYQTRRLQNLISHVLQLRHILKPEKLTKNTPQLSVIMNMARIKIVPNSAFEKSRILWDDC